MVHKGSLANKVHKDFKHPMDFKAQLEIRA